MYHPRGILRQFCFTWDKDKLSGDGGAGRYGGSPVLLARGRNSKSESLWISGRRFAQRRKSKN